MLLSYLCFSHHFLFFILFCFYDFFKIMALCSVEIGEVVSCPWEELLCCSTPSYRPHCAPCAFSWTTGVALSQGDHCLVRMVDLKISCHNGTVQKKRKLTLYGEAENDRREERMCEPVCKGRGDFPASQGSREHIRPHPVTSLCRSILSPTLPVYNSGWQTTALRPSLTQCTWYLYVNKVLLEHRHTHSFIYFL